MGRTDRSAVLGVLATLVAISHCLARELQLQDDAWIVFRPCESGGNGGVIVPIEQSLIFCLIYLVTQFMTGAGKKKMRSILSRSKKGTISQRTKS